MSLLLKSLEILFGGIVIFTCYYYINNAYENTNFKKEDEKEVTKNSKSVSNLSSKESEKVKSPSLRSLEMTCTGDTLPIEKGESTYRYVESLPLDDENSQKISCRKDLLDKSPIQEH